MAAVGQLPGEGQGAVRSPEGAGTMAKITSGLEAARGASARVLAFQGNRDNTMRSIALSTLRAYWEALREGDALPRRSRIDPRGIDNALDIAFIAERIAPGIARLRLAGRQIEDQMGIDVRGMPLSALIAPPARAGFAATLEQVFARPAVAELALAAEPGAQPPQRTGRMLLLPLAAEDGACRLLLGAMALWPAPDVLADEPRRMMVLASELRPLDGSPVIANRADARRPDARYPEAHYPETHHPDGRAASAPGMAEMPAPFEGAPHIARGPALRLVVSNER